MLQLRDIHMGEISQLKPESGVIFKKSLSIGLQKSGFEKKSQFLSQSIWS